MRVDIGQWLGSLNWGSVADWFTGLLTAGTLFVAVMILYTDRRSKRRAAADAFSTWQRLMGTHAVKGKANFTVEVNSYNAGDRPVPFAIIIPSPIGEEQWPGNVITTKGPISPGTHDVHEIPLEESYTKTPLLIVFTDGYGRRWIRGLTTNRYISRRTIRRTWRKWGKVHPMNMLWDFGIPAKKVRRVRDAEMKAWDEKWAAEQAARASEQVAKPKKRARRKNG